MIQKPQLFVTFAPENVAYQRKATLTYTDAGSTCELLEPIGGQWRSISIHTSSDVKALLATIKSWCQGK